MAFKHGRDGEISVDSNDLSAYCDNLELSIDIDTSDTTTFGDDWHEFIAGLAGATVELSGNYDPTATVGPVVVLTGLIAADPFAVTLHPGGDVTGQIQHGFNALLTNYSESTPVADKVTFTASLLVTGAVTTSIV